MATLGALRGISDAACGRCYKYTCVDPRNGGVSKFFLSAAGHGEWWPGALQPGEMSQASATQTVALSVFRCDN